MNHNKFDWSLLTTEDLLKAYRVLSDLRQPDYSFASEGVPYLFRWYVIPKNDQGNVYLHIQTGDDPGDWLHDHRWENFTTVLANGYREVLCTEPMQDHLLPKFYDRKVGDTVFREAVWAHRLMMLPGSRYSMTLFSTGPVIRDWGFWMEGKWHLSTALVTVTPDGRSVLKAIAAQEMS